MQQDAQTKAELAKYDDQLARARGADEHEKYRQRNAELVRMQEESSGRQEQQRQLVAQQIEAERRATDQHKARTLNTEELQSGTLAYKFPLFFLLSWLLRIVMLVFPKTVALLAEQATMTMNIFHAG